jgi:hypothetical protein
MLSGQAKAECLPDTFEEELRCTPQFWDRQSCTCRAPVSTDPCQTGNVALCFQNKMVEFTNRVAELQGQVSELMAWCRDLHHWARANGHNAPLHACEQ